MGRKNHLRLPQPEAVPPQAVPPHRLAGLWGPSGLPPPHDAPGRRDGRQAPRRAQAPLPPRPQAPGWLGGPRALPGPGLPGLRPPGIPPMPRPLQGADRGPRRALQRGADVGAGTRARTGASPRAPTRHGSLAPGPPQLRVVLARPRGTRRACLAPLPCQGSGRPRGTDGVGQEGSGGAALAGGGRLPAPAAVGPPWARGRHQRLRTGAAPARACAGLGSALQPRQASGGPRLARPRHRAQPALPARWVWGAHPLPGEAPDGWTLGAPQPRQRGGTRAAGRGGGPHVTDEGQRGGHDGRKGHEGRPGGSLLPAWKARGRQRGLLHETPSSLLCKTSVITVRNRSKEKGDEPTTYSLNILPYTEIRQGGIPKIGNGGYRKSVTQETEKQQTDLQHRNSNSKLVSNKSNRNKGHIEFKAMGELLKDKLKMKMIDLQKIPESLKVSIEEISSEFGEKRNFRSNLTHVMRILQQSGKKPESFTSYLYEARSITKQQGSVKKQMPYFFRVLEDIVGIQK